MKKRFKRMLSMVLLAAMLLSGGVPALAAEEKTALQMGMLELLARTEEETNDVTDSMESSEDAALPMMKQNDIQVTYYHSLSELLMALDAGYIQSAIADEPTVQYVISRSDAYAESHPAVEQQIEYSMLFREEDGLLCESFNEAIEAMEEDGTLDGLAATYIDGVIAGEEPEAVAFPAFDGADTVTVAVTGDLPPMDYVDDAGQAAGFNTAVLAEIARRLEINIELVQVDSGARTLALSSGRADAAFWVKKNTAYYESDTPAGTVAGESYYATLNCMIVLKDAE